jgi:DegV family protein with EDD domain
MVAARAAADGADVDEVERTVRDARAELKMWFAVDTLEFLRRGGRIGAASAWIGSTLRVKPILTVESELTPVERVRTRSRAFERMVDYARQRHDSGADGWVVQHISAPEEAQRLAQRCRDDVFGCDPLFVSEIGPVVSAHAGPGLLGVGAIPTRFLG